MSATPLPSRLAFTPSGKPITCDGCGAHVELPHGADEIPENMVHPVPDDVALRNYGKTGLNYIVCSPLPDGSQPCLVLAELDDELYGRVRCRRPGCDGTRCSLPTIR